MSEQTKTDANRSRSMQKRIAIQKGEAMPTPAEQLALSMQQSRPPRYNARKTAVVACNVRKLRSELNLPLLPVAKAVGMSVSGLHAVEHGGDVQMTTAQKLAKFFGKSLDELWPS